jgi:hypothetical protein
MAFPPGHFEHDPEKWKPVFRKDHAPRNISAAQFSLTADQMQT